MTVLAIVGVGAAAAGFLLGLLVGSLPARRLRDELTRIGVKLRVAVLPLLEEHAHEIGITREVPDVDNATARVLALADSIKTHQESEKLPFSDTLEVQQSEVASEIRAAAAKRGRGG